jgi:hypothetical protein
LVEENAAGGHEEVVGSARVKGDGESLSNVKIQTSFKSASPLIPPNTKYLLSPHSHSECAKRASGQ